MHRPFGEDSTAVGTSSQATPGTTEVVLREISGQRTIVTLYGEQSVSTRARIAEQFERARMASIVIIDLTPCSSLDSTIIEALFEARDRSLAQRVELVMPMRGGAADRALRLARVPSIFTIYGSLEEALAKAEPARPNV
jgi:anti-anti-sigma regulatory factor